MERLRVAGVFGFEFFIQRNEFIFIPFEYHGDIRSLGIKTFSLSKKVRPFTSWLHFVYQRVRSPRLPYR